MNKGMCVFRERSAASCCRRKAQRAWQFLSCIFSGIILCGLCGCFSVPVESVRSSVSNPLVRISDSGIAYRGKIVMPDDVHKLLEKDRASKEETLHILVDPKFTDARALWVFKNNHLNRYGYSKAIYMHGERHGSSGSVKEIEAREQRQSPISLAPQRQNSLPRKVFR